MCSMDDSFPLDVENITAGHESMFVKEQSVRSLSEPTTSFDEPPGLKYTDRIDSSMFDSLDSLSVPPFNRPNSQEVCDKLIGRAGTEVQCEELSVSVIKNALPSCECRVFVSLSTLVELRSQLGLFSQYDQSRELFVAGNPICCVPDVPDCCALIVPTDVVGDYVHSTDNDVVVCTSRQ